jgi:hypothetical protein
MCSCRCRASQQQQQQGQQGKLKVLSTLPSCGMHSFRCDFLYLCQSCCHINTRPLWQCRCKHNPHACIAWAVKHVVVRPDSSRQQMLAGVILDGLEHRSSVTTLDCQAGDQNRCSSMQLAQADLFLPTQQSGLTAADGRCLLGSTVL